ncbi:MAG: gliding motility-associated C-terminal domain-containing protein [Saprospiraceae bacterium]|nr:gliding motility-associated C-terminal domain-containing protein [Saprospiraceae bacterium]
MTEKCANEYQLIRTWRAIDACGNETTATQTITVEDKKAPVFANVPQNVTLECGMPMPTNAPSVLADCSSIVVKRLESIVSELKCEKTIRITWTAQDDCGNATTATQLVTFKDTQAPVFVNAPRDTMVQCGVNLPAIAPQVVDNCDPTPSVSLLEKQDSMSCGVVITRTWVAKDQCGNLRMFEQRITVKDTIAPVIKTIHPNLTTLKNGDTLTMSCENVRIFEPQDVSVSDNCDVNPKVVFEDLAVRRGTMTRDGFTLLMECAWIATDKCGNKAFYRVFVKITDSIAPILRLPSGGVPADMIVATESQVPPAANVTATDNCSENIKPVLTETRQTIDNQTVITRCWSAIDEAGNTATVCQKITIGTATNPCANDTEAPRLMSAPADVVVASRKDVPTPTIVQANDNCGATVQMTEKEEVMNGDTLIKRTWIATDGAGNKSPSHTQVITIRKKAVICPDLIDSKVHSQVGCQNDTFGICLPIEPNQMSNYTFTLNNAPYTAGFNGCEVKIPTGVSTLIITDKQTGCVDSARYVITCSSLQRIDVTLYEMQTETVCPDLKEMLGSRFKIKNIATSVGDFGTFTLVPGQTCISCAANKVGKQTATFVISDELGVNDTAIINMVVLPRALKVEEPKGLKFYNAFSPNGDGLNDLFAIEGALELPDNELRIFNRWGTEVFKAKGYKNDWGGTWQGQVIPDGTYFYIFDDGAGKTYSGYVQIQR